MTSKRATQWADQHNNGHTTDANGEPVASHMLTGPAVVALMRRHGVTIRALALAMDLPQTRVRRVRQRGLTAPGYCLDYMEGITGNPYHPY